MQNQKCQNPLCKSEQNFYRSFSWFTISLQLKRESEENDSFWIDWPIKIKIFSESSIKMEVGNWRIIFGAFSSKKRNTPGILAKIFSTQSTAVNYGNPNSIYKSLNINLRPADSRANLFALFLKFRILKISLALKVSK